MDLKHAVWVGIFIGSTIGGALPILWGAGVFSFSSLLCTGLGAFGGLWLGAKIAGY